MIIGLSLVLLIFTSGFKQYDCAAICFSCTEMLEDEKCQHVTTCQDNEVCFIQKYRTADNRRLYDVGCTHNQLCPLNSTAIAFGRRTVDHSHIMCHECCNGNVCNSAFTCDDHSKPQLLRCLSCGGVVNVHNCSTSTTCDKDEICFIQKYRTSANKEYFDLGCKRSTMCLNRSPSDLFGRRTEEERHLLCEFCCAEGSLCNRNLNCGQQTNPSECADVSFQKDGVYNINPKGARSSRPAYCVMRNGIKWTVIHRRFNGSVDFDRNWKEYRQGFGNVNGEYWSKPLIFIKEIDADTYAFLCILVLGSTCQQISLEYDDVTSTLNVILFDNLFLNKIRQEIPVLDEFVIRFTDDPSESVKGNEAIHLISTNGKHKLHIDLELRNGSRFYADYSLFKLNNESSQYLLKVTGYSGTAGDAMDNYDRSLGANGAQFSTRDRDNGEYIRNCAELYHGGWWYVSCSNSDLNGNNTIYTKGSLQFWNKNDLKYAGIKQSEMMITKY